MDALVAWMGVPINLSRPMCAQAHRSCQNVRSHIARYAGYAAIRLGTATVKQMGLFVLLDGPTVMSFFAHLLHGRGVGLSTCVQTSLAMAKARGWARARASAGARGGPAPDAGAPQGVSFVLSELLAGDHDAAASYRESFVLLSKQLQAWCTQDPKIKPTFEESVASGSFVRLPDILNKTLPAIEEAVAAFDVASPESAIAVRDAVLLACVAGDASPTQRVGELRWMRNVNVSEGGGCRDPKVRAVASHRSLRSADGAWPNSARAQEAAAPAPRRQCERTAALPSALFIIKTKGKVVRGSGTSRRAAPAGPPPGGRGNLNQARVHSHVHAGGHCGVQSVALPHPGGGAAA